MFYPGKLIPVRIGLAFRTKTRIPYPTRKGAMP